MIGSSGRFLRVVAGVGGYVLTSSPLGLPYASFPFIIPASPAIYYEAQ
jgi:hypothetical protein